MQTAVVPMMLEIAMEAAQVLQQMPLPSYSSYQLVLQVCTAAAIWLLLLSMAALATPRCLCYDAMLHVMLLKIMQHSGF